ncbi:hypothetical protein M9H77_17732 [Catharanthus roseus]|uniref:Uncharacterized protein n=1 Tax=Catharanthus roseus TaxID=4058 RepID=A0ACC0B5G2_CATRO|nr:hypothetical protein M9H77_17732 [Catharanthus roseus]
MKVNTYLIVTRYLSSRTFDRRPYVTLSCERGGANKLRKKLVVDDEEEEVQVKRRGPYETEKCGCPFKLKSEQMAMYENWQVFIHDGRHNHAICVYTHGHAQTAKLTEEQLIKTKQFRKSYVPPRNILRFFLEQNVGCVVRECCLMLVIGDVFNTTYHILCRRHINQNVLAKLTELTKDEEVVLRFLNGSWKKLLDEINEQRYLRKLSALKMKWKSRLDFLHYLFNNWLNLFAHKFVRCWTKSHMHFGVETTNRTENEYLVLKLWLSTCHGDLDTVFLNIDSLIEGQIADINASLEFSKSKEKNIAKSNYIFYIVSNKISYLALKRIWSEIPRATGIYDDPKNKCGHYLRTSHGLPCACELITRFDHALPI